MRLLFQSLYLIVHLAVLGMFVLGLSARYVHPAIAWWLQLLAIGIPVMAAAVGLLAIADVLMQRWLLLTFSMIALVTFGLRYASALTRDAADGSEPLTLVTFNVGGVDPFERDRVAMRPILIDYTPDVMCVQEFGSGYRNDVQRSREDLHGLIDSLGYEIVAPERWRSHRDPPPIISRLSLEDSTMVGLSTRRDADPAGTVLRAQYSWEGRSFVVFNVHLQSFTTQRPWEQGETLSPRAWIRFFRRTSTAFLQRASEAAEIRRLIRREELPIVLCGDFNTTPHQYTYWQLAEGRRDAFRTHGGFWGPTFPARRPLFRIDYILTSDHWLVDAVDVGPELPPDHRPVIARLRLAPK